MAAASIVRTTARNLRLRRGSQVPTNWIQHSALFSTSSSVQVEDASSTWSKMLLFVPGAITFGLGTWQIFRRQEKMKILEHRQSQLGSEPLRGSEVMISNSNLDALEFRRVKFKGIFDDKKSIFIGPRSRSISGVTENGYYIITPLFPIPGDPESAQSPVLVNRGWVPRGWRDKAVNSSDYDKELPSTSSASSQESKRKSWWQLWSKKQGLEEVLPAIAPVEVTGVVRGSENPTIFVPANDPNTSQWFYVDVPAIARACQLPEETLYVEDINENINPRNPYPIPKDVNALIRSSVMPQDHLNYMITWYSLSAAVTFMAVKRIKLKNTTR